MPLSQPLPLTEFRAKSRAKLRRERGARSALRALMDRAQRGFRKPLSRRNSAHGTIVRGILCKGERFGEGLVPGRGPSPSLSPLQSFAKLRRERGAQARCARSHGPRAARFPEASLPSEFRARHYRARNSVRGRGLERGWCPAEAPLPASPPYRVSRQGPRETPTGERGPKRAARALMDRAQRGFRKPLSRRNSAHGTIVRGIL